AQIANRGSVRGDPHSTRPIGGSRLSHQVIDLALHGPHGSPASWNESETLFALIEDIFTAGGDTPTPSPNGSTSPDEQPQPPRS
ncbi:hypothetical protein, partial [Kocuria subflava]|uniref:hypothetical protein n=1 Tax=Kocuria subflava TaxID=1736139 RepID=UPI001ADF76B6